MNHRPLPATRFLAAAALAAGTASIGGAATALAEQAGLSHVEEAMATAIDSRRDAAIALLERAVNINSGTTNPEGVRKVGEIFAAELRGLGFAPRWIDGSAWGRAGHLVAERPASVKGHAAAGKAPRILLIGHLDTVFDADSPFQHFERLPGDRASGPGVIDMKGGDVVMLEALRALRAAGTLDRLEVTVVLTGDEEDSGSPLALARRDLLAAAAGADVALGFEDGDGKPEHAVVARRGSIDWKLVTRGTPAHSSQIFQPEVGAGAVYEAARILHGFYSELAGEANLTFNPGLVLGGTKTELAADGTTGTASGKGNVVAAEVLVNGDLRTLSPGQLASAEARMQSIAAAHLPGTGAELTFGEGYPPMAPAPGNLELLALFDQVSRDLGLGPVTAVDPRNAGAADVSFAAASVPRILDALGLKGSGGHTVEETADLSTLTTQAKRAALLMHRIAGGALGSR